MKVSAGQRFRAAYERDFEPDDAGEQAVLEQVIQLLDRVEQMNARIDADGRVVVGGNGQSAPHPLLAQVRVAAETVGRLIARLGLHDETPARLRARAAARSRWDRQSG